MKRDRFYLQLAILLFGLSLLSLTYKNYFATFTNLALGILSFLKDIYKEKMSIPYWVKKKNDY